MQLVDTESKQLVAMKATAREAWIELEDKFDRRNVTSTFHTLNACLPLTMDTSASMTSHLLAFKQLFDRLSERCPASDPKGKAHLLLRTLPSSMANIVDNLQSKKDVTYHDVRATLLDLSPSSKPLLVKKFAKKSKSGQIGQQNQQGQQQQDGCTFCKKHGRNFKGHTYRTCKVLKDFKNQTATPTSTGKAHIATEEAAQGVAFLATASDFSGSALKSVTAHEVWFFDTAASHHITANLSHLTNPFESRVGIKVGGGRILYPTHVGTVNLNADVNGQSVEVTLSNVLYIPEWNEGCLISWTQISKLGKCKMEGEDDRICVRLKENNKVVFITTQTTDGLFHLPVTVQRGNGHAYMSKLQYWHESLGHTSPQSWNHSLYSDGENLTKRPPHFFCSACARYNSEYYTPLPVKQRTNVIGDLFHTDIAGPFTTQTLGGRQYHMPIIEHQTAAAYSPESNGIAERYNLTLANMVRPSLGEHPKYLWAEAFNWAVYLKNRLPHTSLQGKTPYTALHYKRPTISHVYPFFTKCIVHIPEDKRAPGTKLEARSIEGRLVGYTCNHMFRVYIPSKRSVDSYRQVTFTPLQDMKVSIDIITSSTPTTTTAPSPPGPISTAKPDLEAPHNATTHTAPSSPPPNDSDSEQETIHVANPTIPPPPTRVPATRATTPNPPALSANGGITHVLSHRHLA